MDKDITNIYYLIGEQYQLFVNIFGGCQHAEFQRERKLLPFDLGKIHLHKSIFIHYDIS